MKLLLTVLTLFSFTAYAQNSIRILERNKPTIQDINFLSSQDSSFEFLNKLGMKMAVVKIKVGNTSEGIKAEAIRSTIHASWRGPLAEYEVHDDKIQVTVSAMDEQGKIQTKSRSFIIDEDDSIQELNH